VRDVSGANEVGGALGGRGVRPGGWGRGHELDAGDNGQEEAGVHELLESGAEQVMEVVEGGAENTIHGIPTNQQARARVA
jgi:hypothetical protein